MCILLTLIIYLHMLILPDIFLHIHTIYVYINCISSMFYSLICVHPQIKAWWCWRFQRGCLQRKGPRTVWTEADIEACDSIHFRGFFPFLEMILMAVAPQCETLLRGATQPDVQPSCKVAKPFCEGETGVWFLCSSIMSGTPWTYLLNSLHAMFVGLLDIAGFFSPTIVARRFLISWNWKMISHIYYIRFLRCHIHDVLYSVCFVYMLFWLMIFLYS